MVTGFAWDTEDGETERWYPQGISTGPGETVLVSWALDGHKAARLSFVDAAGGEAPRYFHALLVEPDMTPVPVHAGGIACDGDFIYVADTIRGVRVFAADGLLAAPGDREGPHGHRFVLPQIGAYRHRILRALWNRGPLFSFLSLSSDEARPRLLSGEYKKDTGSRIVGWPIPASAGSEELQAEDAWESERSHHQGVLELADRLLTASSSGRNPGSLAVYDRGGGEPRAVHPWAVGPEDLAYDRERDLVLSLTERTSSECTACGRVVFAIPASAFM